MREHIRVTTQPMPEPPVATWLDDIFEMMYADELMFSTDCPDWDGDDPDWALKRVPNEFQHTIMIDIRRSTTGWRPDPAGVGAPGRWQRRRRPPASVASRSLAHRYRPETTTCGGASMLHT